MSPLRVNHVGNQFCPLLHVFFGGLWLGGITHLYFGYFLKKDSFKEVLDPESMLIEEVGADGPKCLIQCLLLCCHCFASACVSL